MEPAEADATKAERARKTAAARILTIRICWCKREAIDRGASRRERSKDRKKVEEAERLLECRERVAGGEQRVASKGRVAMESKSGSGAGGVFILFESWWREDARGRN